LFKTTSFHASFIKKKKKRKDANDVVLMALFVIFFLGTCKDKDRGRRFFFPSFATPISLSSPLA
jgi:hypothetical protein